MLTGSVNAFSITYTMPIILKCVSNAQVLAKIIQYCNDFNDIKFFLNNVN